MNPEKKYYLMQIQQCEPLMVMLEIINLEKRCTMIYCTTIDGVMQKEESTSEEFEVADKLKELYNLGEYGKYADKKSKG